MSCFNAELYRMQLLDMKTYELELSDDIEKINKFSELFSELLKTYGYSSAEIYGIKITKDNYLPFLDGFDLTLESSASDNIRIIWAYSVAMLYMTHWYRTNHFGFLIFDMINFIVAFN